MSALHDCVRIGGILAPRLPDTACIHLVQLNIPCSFLASAKTAVESFLGLSSKLHNFTARLVRLASKTCYQPHT